MRVSDLHFSPKGLHPSVGIVYYKCWMWERAAGLGGPDNPQRATRGRPSIAYSDYGSVPASGVGTVSHRLAR